MRFTPSYSAKMSSLRQRLALPSALLILALGSLCALMIGDLPLSLRQLWDGLFRHDELAATVLWDIRLPRLLVAILVGGALSASGLVMQTYFRNSLASPGLLGVSSGGAAGAVIVIGAGLASSQFLVVPLASLIGAFLATGAVLSLAKRGASTERLLLAGIALNALLSSVVSFVLSNSALSFERTAHIMYWLLGGLEDRTWEHVGMASPIAICALLLCPLGRQMDLLSLGEREAQSLGVNVRALRWQLLIFSTVLTALATAVAGTVGFVGLIVPHTLRLLVGPDHRRLLPLSLLAGAAFVVCCDLISRVAPGSLRIGIITSFIGAPFFLWQLRRQS